MPGDIFKCTGCGESVHIDSTEHCFYCDSNYCGACQSDNIEYVYDSEEDGLVPICKSCSNAKKGEECK